MIIFAKSKFGEIDSGKSLLKIKDEI